MEDKRVEKVFDGLDDLLADISRVGVEAQEKVNEYEAYITNAFGPMPENSYQLARFIARIIRFALPGEEEIGGS